MSTVKVSTTLDAARVAEAKARVGERGFSRFLDESLAMRLHWARLEDLERELAEEFGPIQRSRVARSRRWSGLGRRAPRGRVASSSTAAQILALARGDGRARAVLERARREGYVVVIPTPVLAQVHRGGRDRAPVDRVVNRVDALLPTSEAVARHAGELMARSGTSDAVDAIVAAEALMSVPALIMTSDADDLIRLVGDEPAAARSASSACDQAAGPRTDRAPSCGPSGAGSLAARSSPRRGPGGARGPRARPSVPAPATRLRARRAGPRPRAGSARGTGPARGHPFQMRTCGETDPAPAASATSRMAAGKTFMPL